MPPKKGATDSGPIGPLLPSNFFRLDYADVVVRFTELESLVSEKTARTCRSQRISAVVNAVNVNRETIALLAEAIGVKPAELTKPVEVKAVPSN